jgi:peptidoglycan hydrolase CwlO-like protein
MLTRREALKLLAGAGALLAATPAFAETEEELRAKADQTQAQIDEVQGQYDAAMVQLDALAGEVQELSIAQAQTLDQIYATEEEIYVTQEQISDTEEAIASRERELGRKQERLSKRISSAYKTGGTNFLDILLSSSSFEELESNIYYLDKISENDEKLIADVKAIKAELEEKKAWLEEQKAELESRLAELEELNAIQQEQLDSLRAKQDEVSAILASVDARVQELIAQHDAELLAADQEAERARQAREAAAASGGGSDYRVDPSSLIQGASGSAQAVVSACYTTPSPGGGLCAWWVEDVFERAGIGSWGGNACDLYNMYCYSSDTSAIQPGMIVAVSTYPSSGLGAIYGHVGIYIGGGLVMENVGFINTQGLDTWIESYSGLVTPRWGWMGGVALS